MARKINPKPPFLAKWLLGKIPFSSLRDSYLGDLDEDYARIREKNGRVRAYTWYWLQAVNSLPQLLKSSTISGFGMYKNYFKIALRNLIKYKGYSFINVTGLALGIACSILITLWVLDEFSYDRFHENAENLYRVERDIIASSGARFHLWETPYPLAPALVQEIPEIENVSRYVRRIGGVLLSYENQTHFETNIKSVDPGFLKMFSFMILEGNESSMLAEPFSIILTEAAREKYFPGGNAVGKVISFNAEHSLTVTGVIKDLPRNTFFSFDMLVPYDFARILGRVNNNWNSNATATFVQLSGNASREVVGEKITAIIDRNSSPVKSGTETLFMVKPLVDLRLFNETGVGGRMNGAIKYVYMFSAVALFILLIAIINFMNLSTARSVNRAKEVGIRKVVGAKRSNILKQFYGESVIFAFISLVFALGIVAFFLPSFNYLAGKEVSFGMLGNVDLILILIGVTFLTGIFAGSYPSLFLSSFKPVSVLKGDGKAGSKSSAFRKVLVVIQFTLSIFLVISTSIIFDQLQFMQNKNMGFDKDNLLYVRVRGGNQNYNKLKMAITGHSSVFSVSGSSFIPTSFDGNTTDVDWEGKRQDNTVRVNYLRTDFDYAETMKIAIAAGRDFSPEFATDTLNAFLINERLAAAMGKRSVLGERFSFGSLNGTIIGVVKDFHYPSLRVDINPLLFLARPSQVSYAIVRIAPEKTSETIRFIKSTWESFVPEYPFEYRFLDEFIDQLYRTEERTGNLLKYFTALAILIASLGLFGLASYSAERRTKEIGIRKVLGASPNGMVLLLCKEFLLLVVIANVFSWPVSWYLMDGWQQGFAYRAGLNPIIFLSAGFLALVVALLTVSFQAAKAAYANPVAALKYE